MFGIAHEFREGLKANASDREQRLLKYVSGLWLDYIHHGLRWQSVEQRVKLCTCGAPSWSWAFHLGGVVWLPKASKCVNKLSILAFTDASGLHPISGMNLWPPTISANTDTGTGDTPLEDSGKSDLMTAAGSLLVKGQMQWLSIDNSIERIEKGPGLRKDLEHGTVDTLARETGVDLPDDFSQWKNDPLCQRAGDWRFICTPSRRDIIGGWALFESDHLASLLNAHENFTIRAPHVSTRPPIAPGGRSTATKFWMYHDVYDVIFVDEVDDGVFRRLGVGMIMDKVIMQEFDQTAESELTLMW